VDAGFRRHDDEGKPAMKVLVTGAAGLLGHDVWSLFERKHDLIALGRTQAPWIDAPRFRECDLTNAAHTYAVVTKENPEVIVHCAAFNNVDAAERQPEQAYRGNALATRNLALACQRFDATLISLSTDYVFDGSHAPATGYREFDTPKPNSRYGESKRWAEKYVESLLNKYFIVRTSWLFGPSRRTWVDQVADLARQKKPVQAALDMVSSPTYTPDLAQSLLQLAESRHYGIYHLSNQGFCSRVELAHEVLKIQKLSGYKQLQKRKCSQLKLAAPRPTFSGLDNLAWRLDGFPPLRSWKEALYDHFARKKVTA
jgi:dTDP-4-dehydrorhamnose reductase